MKRSVCVLALVAVACVPASEELPAAGAAGFDTAPSAETAGAPFETSDGWTLRIERFVLQANVYATTLSRGYGNSEAYLFDAQKPARMFARALPVGPAAVRIGLYGRYLRAASDGNDYFDNVERINVDDEVEARFARLPDDGQQNDYTPGPSLLVIVRGERAGRVVTLDAALNVTNTSSSASFRDEGASVDVRKNEISAVPLPIRAEMLFPLFHDVADSDTDGDGTVTGGELRSSGVRDRISQRMPALLLEE